MTTIKAADEWTAEMRKLAASGLTLAYPSETLVRLFKGKYIPGMPTDFRGMKALDVGFGGGNNLRFLAGLGLEVSGTEISQAMCDVADAELRSAGITAELKIGTNTALPFPDATFDFLVSWNVIHYEDNEASMVAAIAEYARVLKPGGRVVVSTTGPDHAILRDGKTLGHHRYEIAREDDFRKGTVYFYFDAENYVRHYFGRSFDNVLTGRTHDRLFTDTLDWFIVTGTARG